MITNRSGRLRAAAPAAFAFALVAAPAGATSWVTTVTGYDGPVANGIVKSVLQISWESAVASGVVGLADLDSLVVSLEVGGAYVSYPGASPWVDVIVSGGAVQPAGAYARSASDVAFSLDLDDLGGSTAGLTDFSNDVFYSAFGNADTLFWNIAYVQFGGGAHSLFAELGVSGTSQGTADSEFLTFSTVEAAFDNPIPLPGGVILLPGALAAFGLVAARRRGRS